MDVVVARPGGAVVAFGGPANEFDESGNVPPGAGLMDEPVIG